MRAMILAAGRGERMGDLTKNLPKPLLRVGNQLLIEYAIFSLRKAGVENFVINVCYHKDLIKSVLGDGSRYGAQFFYSDEETALETGGGILKALPLLGPEPFIVTSGDIITDFDFRTLPRQLKELAHLILVDNPSYKDTGDFGLTDQNTVFTDNKNPYTFANIGVYHPLLFKDLDIGRFKLGPLLKEAAKQGKVTGEYFAGLWHNIGTPEVLQQFSNSSSLI